MSGMFVLHGEGELVEMTEQPYGTEALLQALLAEYPNLLAGDQMDAAAPRRWLLVSREMGVPSGEDGGDRWSLDHLFLDQDAIPTLIEVKRSTDTRIRREVVGQMLDYAANAVAYWPVETIRAKFEQGCTERKVDPNTELLKVLAPGASAEQFWGTVKTNLQAGKVRMVFVADVIPPELRRIVEFLNGQMNPAPSPEPSHPSRRGGAPDIPIEENERRQVTLPQAHFLIRGSPGSFPGKGLRAVRSSASVSLHAA